MDDHRRFKDTVYEIFARLGKALAAPKRLELLDLLCQAPRTVEALAAQAAISVANVSQHLHILRVARLVTAERHGLYVEYRLADDDVARCFVALRHLAETRFSDMGNAAQEFMRTRGDNEAVDLPELQRRHRRGDVTIIDVRPAEEYRAGHFPGAVSIPLPELKSRIAELPKHREVVAYCRGPYCVMAVEAVAWLRKRGFRAQRMEQGIADWKLQGLPIDVGSAEAHP
ncbi:MAG TPA: metalloregulator ArsR/SmtB family transcription factor [Steroidobacteraceae bacterium]